VDEIVSSYKQLIENLKKNPTKIEGKDLRLINATVLILQVVTSFLLPVLIRGFTSGFTALSTDYKCARIVDEHIRFGGVVALGLVLVNYLSKSWPADVQKDIAKIMTIVYLFGALVTLLVLYNGGSFIYLFVLLVDGGLSYFHAKETGLLGGAGGAKSE
jgi:hypothetical protein